jgi:hypothetical protein
MKKHFFRTAWMVTLVCGFAFPICAAAPKVAGASVDPNNRRHIIVNFDDPVPAAASVENKTFWIVYEKTATSPNTTATKRLEVERVDTSGLAPTSSEKLVDLFLTEDIAGKPTIKELDIVLANATDYVALPALTKDFDLGTGPGGAQGELTAAKSKADSDIYFNGSYAAVMGGSPVYNIDAFAGYMWALQKKDAYYGHLGFYGQATTKMSSTADPNSFQTYLVYQYVIGSGGWWGPFQSPILNYRFLGTEFDKSANELNLTTSPVLTIPFRPVPPPQKLNSKISQWPQFNLIMGTEFVGVEKSTLAPTGWHTRGLFGANFAFGYAPKTKGFDSIQLTSAWQVRLPSAPEIFYDDKFAPIDPKTGMKNTKATPAMLGTQPRHYLDTKLTYNYAVWGGVTFEHTYGSLPPAFNKTDQTFTIGLTFTLQQASFGRTSILRP